MSVLQYFSWNYGNITRLSLFYMCLIHYFYNSKTNKMRPPKTDCIFEICIKKYVELLIID